MMNEMETEDTVGTDVMQRCWKVGSLPRTVQAVSLFLVLTLTKSPTKKTQDLCSNFFHLCFCLEPEGKLGNR